MRIFLVFLASCVAFSLSAPAADFELTVVVPMRNEERLIRMGGDQRKPSFHVVLKNVSDTTQRIWEEWNSWGYYNLSFELTEKEGKTVQVLKEPQVWTKNFPSCETLLPGEMRIFDIWWPGEWKNLPPKADASQPASLVAVFTTNADRDTAKFSVWTGTVRSPKVDVSLQSTR